MSSMPDSERGQASQAGSGACWTSFAIPRSVLAVAHRAADFVLEPAFNSVAFLQRKLLYGNKTLFIDFFLFFLVDVCACYRVKTKTRLSFSSDVFGNVIIRFLARKACQLNMKHQLASLRLEVVANTCLAPSDGHKKIALPVVTSMWMSRLLAV